MIRCFALAAWAACAALAAPARAAPADAAHDLTGVWTTASWTRLQRPKDAPGLVITEAQGQALHAAGLAKAKAGDALGQMTSEFEESGEGYARIGGQLRSSWLVDPPDGRLPYTDAARKAMQAHDDADAPGDYDNVETRPTGERCLTADGAGAPTLNSPDTNLVTIVQAPSAVAIVSEKNHDARAVAIGAPAPDATQPRSWLGTSVGHWEGRTLVVTTSRLREGVTYVTDNLPLSGAARVTERFTLNGPDEIAYDFTIEDPATYTRPLRAEMVMRRAKGLMYEYACHEGNYALPGILAGGQKEQAAKEK